MNSKTLWAVIIIVLLAGIAYWYTGNRPVAEPASQQQSGSQYAAVDPLMTGTWKSTDDAKFTRTFNADGTITDAYEGDASATATGTYTTVDPLKEPAGALGAVPLESLTGMTVLKVTFPQSEVMYFGVNSLTETSLTLTVLSGRGNILSFTKVQ